MASSLLRTRLLRFLTRQAPNRVYWLGLTLVVGGLITFIENQFDGQDMHTLAGRYIDSGLNPTALIRRWEPNRQRLAWLDVLDASGGNTCQANGFTPHRLAQASNIGFNIGQAP